MKITRIFSYILLLIIVVLGLTFAATNANPVHIDYYFNTAEVSLSLLLVYALGVGILLGFFTAFVSTLRLKNQNRKLKNQLKKAELALKESQSIPPANTLEASIHTPDIGENKTL